MSKYLAYGGIAVLAVIAVVLGYLIYQQTRVSQTPSVPQTRDTTVPQTEVSQQGPTQRELTEEEKQVLNFPGPNATNAERKVHSDLVNKLGNESGLPYLDISNCRPSPIVYRASLGGAFNVKNSSQIDHTIYTTGRTTIKANSEQTISSVAIGENLGDYGYGCDGSTSPVGIIQIVP